MPERTLVLLLVPDTHVALVGGRVAVAVVLAVRLARSHSLGSGFLLLGHRFPACLWLTREPDKGEGSGDEAAQQHVLVPARGCLSA